MQKSHARFIAANVPYLSLAILCVINSKTSQENVCVNFSKHGSHFHVHFTTVQNIDINKSEHDAGIVTTNLLISTLGVEAGVADLFIMEHLQPRLELSGASRKVHFMKYVQMFTTSEVFYAICKRVCRSSTGASVD